MPLTYYYDLLSQPSRAVYIFLKVNKIPFEAKPVALGKGEHKQDWFAKLNPFQCVPTIDDDGFVLSESVAILRYLAEKYKVSENWFPKSDLKTMGRHEQYLHWQHTNTRQQSMMLFLNLTLFPQSTGKPVNQEEVEKYTKSTKKVVADFDSFFLKDKKKFVCGDKISVADLLCMCELQQLKGCCREKLYEENANVGKWMKRMEEEIGDDLYKETHVSVQKIRTMCQETQK